MADQRAAVLELRYALERAADNGLVAKIDPQGVRDYRNGKKALSISQWAKKLATADTALNDFFQKKSGGLGVQKSLLQHCNEYFNIRLAGETRSEESLEGLWTELLRGVASLQQQTLINLFRLAYEQRYKLVLGRNGVKTIAGAIHPEGSSAWKDKELKQFLERFHDSVVNLNKYVLTREDKKLLAEAQKLFLLCRKDYYGYHQGGLGLLAEAIRDAFKTIGFSATLGEVRAIAEKSYLEAAATKGVPPNPAKRDSHMGQTFGQYLYVWWLFENEEEYQKIAKDQKYPRTRSKLSVEYREPSEKYAELDELLKSAKHGSDVKGTYLGSRDLVRRRQRIEDWIKIPPLRPGQVIALGATRLKLFDLAKKKLRTGSWFHGVERRPNMSPLRYLIAWAKEGMIRFDAGDLEWHWNKWDGDLPVPLGRIKGQVIRATDTAEPEPIQPVLDTTFIVYLSEGREVAREASTRP